MHWLAFMAASATIGLAKKLIARHRHGNEIPLILEDPPDVRTLARFVLEDRSHARDLLAAIASALAPEVDGWVATEDAIRARRPGHAHEVEVVRLVARGGSLCTVELTRAWTGAELGEPTRALLVRMHATLSTHPAVRELAWHGRQDRALVIGFPVPVAAPAPAPGPAPGPDAGMISGSSPTRARSPRSP